MAGDGGSGEDTRRDAVVAAEENWRRNGWPAGPAFLASLSVLRVEQLIRSSNMAALSPHGLTHSRHEALALIYFSHDHQLPLTKLSERLMVQPASVTSTIDALERLGFVRRIPHPSDRRVTLAQVTDAGRAALEASSLALGGSQVLSALDDEEALTLFRLLAKVRSRAGDPVEPVDLGAGPVALP